MRQQTLARSFTLDGRGIHTGAAARVILHPAPAQTGRVFRNGRVSIPACAANVVDTGRCTVLACDGVRVGTVEHLLSALNGCGIDNAIAEVNGPELPILDGSARPFVDAIRDAGVHQQEVETKVMYLQAPVRIAAGPSSIEAAPSDSFMIEVTTRFEEWPEGDATVTVSMSDSADYVAKIASARTFAFLHELGDLQSAGLARGGSLSNALIIQPPAGFSSDLRMPNEWCAHKALDLVGDLSLLGARACFRVTAVRPGHRLNNLLVRKLLEQPVAASG